MKPVKEVEIVLGLCERDGKLLMIQRQDSNPQWDKKWEFPGGKIDAGETREAAVCREIQEETGLQVLQHQYFIHHTHDWELDDRILRVKIDCFHCVLGEGEVTLETDKAYQYAWASLDEAMTYDSLSANLNILERFSACTNIEHGLK